MATGQNIADEARADLNDGDASNLRWTDAEMVRYINAAQRQIVTLLPEANVTETSVELTTEDPRRTIPSGGIKFLWACNYDNAASARGPAMTPIEFDALYPFPEWSYPGHQANYFNQAPTLEDEHTVQFFDHYAHDPRDPKAFWLSAAPDTSGDNPYILIGYSANPTALGSLASNFALGDEYINAAVEYVKFRMLMKDGRYGSGAERRTELWNNFRLTLGLKPEVERRVDPSNSRAGGDANG